jgi:glycosyltransferase involved in cell wall biosynthesis
MKVMQVIHYPVFGGPHSEARALAPILERNGWDMTILLPDEPGNAFETLRSAGLDVITMPLRRLRGTLDPAEHLRSAFAFRREVQAIRSVISERRIDLVQASGLVNIHAAAAARLEGAPLVWQLIDTRAPMALRRLIMPLVVRWADVVMTTGEAVAREHPGSERLGERLRVFYMPVDADLFVPEHLDRGRARAEFGFEVGDHVLGTVGNLNPQKGHEYLLRAAARARMDLDGVKLLVVGAAHDTHREYERMLYELARSLGLEVGVDVVFTGALRDVRPALAAMDVFLCSSVPRSEGAPAAVEEAMMMAVPVVASRVGALAEVVSDGITGYLVPPLDSEAIAEAVVRLFRAPDRSRAMGERGRERALARFSADDCAAIHADAYESAVRHRASLSRRS